MIVQVQKVGSINGQKEDIRKKMCEENRVCINMLEGVVGTTDSVVLPNAMKCTVKGSAANTIDPLWLKAYGAHKTIGAGIVFAVLLCDPPSLALSKSDPRYLPKQKITSQNIGLDPMSKAYRCTI